MARISRKNSWLRCLASFLSAAGAAALLCVILEGPRLGFLYDFLLMRRPARPVSRELLIIDSSIPPQEPGDGILEPQAASSLLYTLAELGARTLIIQVPILGLSAGGTTGEEEILARFDDEFSVLSGNIRNLFDAIRTGAIAPLESARYVGELLELSERGKDRLISALVLRDEEGIVSMEKAAALFGHARRPGDLQVQLISSGEGGRPGVLAESGEYSRAQPDRDGVVRRLAPMVTAASPSGGGTVLEHIVYAALKTRFEGVGIALTKTDRALVLRADSEERIIPLDRNGAVLFGLSQKKAAFRRIGIADFLAYDEADRGLRLLLLEAEAAGIFRGVEGENNPGILYDYAFYMREEPASSFRNGNEEKKLVWIEARNRYFASLDDFLNGPAEVKLVEEYELRIASESGERAGLTEARNSLIRMFAALRAKHNEVITLRSILESALSSSFCILGSSRDAEASALLANSLLSGDAVEPGDARRLLLLALLPALFVCLLVRSREAAPTLLIGLLLTLLIGTGFSVSFMLSGLWFDPQVPVAASAAGVLVSAVWALAAKARYNRTFRQAYGPFVSRSRLEGVIRAGKPLPSEAVTVAAVVVAVKKTRVASPRELLDFHKDASDIFRKAGATITGIEGNIVTVCFGSPLERAAAAADEAGIVASDAGAASVVCAVFAKRASSLVSKITKRPEFAAWEFGMDAGYCGFSWAAASGYSAIGAPVQKARILSHLAGRYKTRVVVSASINKILPGLSTLKLGGLKRKDGGPDEAFFGLRE